MDLSRRELLAAAGKFVILWQEPPWKHLKALRARWRRIEIQNGGPLVGHDHRYPQVHWMRNCVRACSAENDVPEGFFRTWVERYEVHDDDRVHPVVESPDGGMHGFPVRTTPGVKSFFVPKLCNHCAHSPCVQACPVGATYVSPDGVVLVDQQYCVGCGYCVQACPYGTRYLHPTKHVADK